MDTFAGAHIHTGFFKNLLSVHDFNRLKNVMHKEKHNH